MTRVGASGIPGPGAVAETEPRRNPLDEDARGHPADVGTSLGMRGRFANTGAGSDETLERRGADFMARMQKALRQDHTESADADIASAGKMIAIAAGPVPQANMLAPVAAALPSPAPDMAEQVENIVARVETALAAAERGGRGEVSVALDLSVLGTVIAGATVRMSPGAIDIVLICRQADLGGIAGVQSLADRLRSRFGQRVVRILQDESAATPVSGMEEVSRLLGAGRGRE